MGGVTAGITLIVAMEKKGLEGEKPPGIKPSSERCKISGQTTCHRFEGARSASSCCYTGLLQSGCPKSSGCRGAGASRACAELGALLRWCLHGQILRGLPEHPSSLLTPGLSHTRGSQRQRGASSCRVLPHAEEVMALQGRTLSRLLPFLTLLSGEMGCFSDCWKGGMLWLPQTAGECVCPPPPRVTPIPSAPDFSTTSFAQRKDTEPW